MDIKTCHFLQTFDRTAKFNMDFDKAMMESLGRNRLEQLWRVYDWNPAAISLGKNQKIEQVINLEHTSKAGLDIVIRPTGGRAIYHKNDICISLAGLLSLDEVGGSSAQVIYNKFAHMLARFFDNLNIKTSLARGTRLDQEFRTGKGKLPCFLSATPYELVSQERKKLAGIALFVGKDRYLVQSSVTNQPLEIEDFMFFRGLRSSDELLASVTSLTQEAGRIVNREEICRALLKALSESAGCNVITLEESEIRGGEKKVR